jgi:hypothetical protein
MGLDAEAVAALIDRQLARYTASGVDDVYKLLYQAILGPEHLIADTARFALRLREELAVADGGVDEVLWEPIRPDGQLGRLHLRPFNAADGDPEALLTACLYTAERSWGAVSDLQAVWPFVVRSIEAGRWSRLIPADALRLTEELVATGYGARHHSAAYRAAYRPSYRLVAQQELRRLQRAR